MKRLERLEVLWILINAINSMSDDQITLIFGEETVLAALMEIFTLVEAKRDMQVLDLWLQVFCNLASSGQNMLEILYKQVQVIYELSNVTCQLLNLLHGATVPEFIAMQLVWYCERTAHYYSHYETIS